MTAIKDPYPETLDDVPFVPPGEVLPPQDPQVKALNRIAVALEQIALNLMDRPQPVQNGSGAALATLPPVQTPQGATADVCPIHGTPWKVVPAGVSKRTGKAYESFRACSTAGCDQRPRI